MNMSDTDGISNAFSQLHYKEYFDQLVKLTRSLQKIGATQSTQEFIEEVEITLDEIVSFIYYRFYRLNKITDKLEVLCELGPEELQLDKDLFDWSIRNDGPSYIPITTDADQNIKAMILLPIINQKPFGIICLWVDYGSDGFNMYRSLALKMLSQELASVMSVMELTDALKDQTNFVESIISSIPSGLIATKPDGQIVHINSNAEILFNIRRNDVLGKSLTDSLPEKIASHIRALNVGADRQGGDERDLDWELGEGNVLYLGLSSSLIRNEAGEHIGYVIICRDLALSREVAKLRELDTMKNDFVSLVSHELRTPLSSIISYAEVLLTPGMVDSKEETEEFLKTILDEGHRLSRLINDILDLSKSESGKMEYIFAPHDVNAIVVQCFRNSKHLAENKEIELQLKLQENLPEVSCDMDRIIQVVLNVLSNAVKFTSSKGLIIGYTRLIENENGKKCIQVEIKDNGCGIAESDFDKVFNKFEQVESVESHSSGTGLGMPICKNIVEQGHGGRMHIKSKLGVGTSMFFELPI